MMMQLIKQDYVTYRLIIRDDNLKIIYSDDINQHISIQQVVEEIFESSFKTNNIIFDKDLITIDFKLCWLWRASEL